MKKKPNDQLAKRSIETIKENSKASIVASIGSDDVVSVSVSGTDNDLFDLIDCVVQSIILDIQNNG